MKRILSIAVLSFSVSTVFAQAHPCCETCTCAYCVDIESCEATIGIVESECDYAGALECGVGHPSSILCSTWWENNNQGVTNDQGSSVSNPTGCIPIDGGLGFLIAGGLGIGVLGIRRRNDITLLETAA